MTDARLTEAQEWIEETTGEPFQGDFQEHLKSGVVLCNLVNKLKPGTIKKISKSKMPFMQMENVNAYIEASKSLGVPDQYSFVTIDLFESKNLIQVAQNIITLKRELGYGFKKQAPQQVSDYGTDQSIITNPSIAAELPQSEAPIQISDGTRTGAAFRPGQGQVDEERLSKNCKACDRFITSGFVNACGYSWHPKCFTCKKCGTTLSRTKYYVHENNAHCERCILQVNPKAKINSATKDMGFQFAK